MTKTCPPPLLSIKDVAALYQVSTKTVRRWIKAGDITAAKLGNQWRMHPKDVERFFVARLSR